MKPSERNKRTGQAVHTYLARVPESYLTLTGLSQSFLQVSLSDFVARPLSIPIPLHSKRSEEQICQQEAQQAQSSDNLDWHALTWLSLDAHPCRAGGDTFARVLSHSIGLALAQTLLFGLFNETCDGGIGFSELVLHVVRGGGNSCRDRTKSRFLGGRVRGRCTRISEMLAVGRTRVELRDGGREYWASSSREKVTGKGQSRWGLAVE